MEINATMPLKEEFIFVYHSLFAKNMHLRSSKNKDFHFKIPKKIEPRSLKVMDFKQDTTNINKETGLGSLMCIINYIDETMFYDVIDPTCDTSSKEKVEAMSVYIKSNRQYSPIGMHETEYPYVVSLGNDNSLQMYNADHPKEVKGLFLA